MNGGSENDNDLCLNCGNVDFVDDERTGDCICTGCGLVQGPILLDSLSYRELYDSYGNKRPHLLVGGNIEVPRGLPNCDVKMASAPYSEITYLNERIAQWRQLEPPIPYKDYAAISNAYAGDGRHTDKTEIRALLGGIDAARKAAGKKPRFIRKYLEKWLSIRFQLTGVRSRGCYAPDWLVQAVRTRFAEILRPFKDRIKNKGRYSIINVNFMFRRIFDLEGMQWYAVDFPPLRTDSKRRRLVNMWVECCEYTRYPYINNDQITFPHVKFYEPIAWSKTDNGRRSESGDRKRKRGKGYDPAAVQKRFDKCAERWVQRYY